MVAWHGAVVAMLPIAADLRHASSRVSNIDGPSRTYDVTGPVRRFVAPVIERCPADGPIDLVTHTLGCILIRVDMQGHPLPEMRNFIVVETTYMLMMFSRRVCHQVRYLLVHVR